MVLTLLGIAEIGFGLLTLLFHKSRLWYRLLMSLLAILMLGAWITDPQLMKAPFNPLTLSGSMMGFCLMASLSAADLPSAYRPARKPVPGDKSRKKEGKT